MGVPRGVFALSGATVVAAWVSQQKLAVILCICINRTRLKNSAACVFPVPVLLVWQTLQSFPVVTSLLLFSSLTPDCWMSCRLYFGTGAHDAPRLGHRPYSRMLSSPVAVFGLPSLFIRQTQLTPRLNQQTSKK